MRPSVQESSSRNALGGVGGPPLRQQHHADQRQADPTSLRGLIRSLRSQTIASLLPELSSYSSSTDQSSASLLVPTTRATIPSAMGQRILGSSYLKQSAPRWRAHWVPVSLRR